MIRAPKPTKILEEKQQKQIAELLQGFSKNTQKKIQTMISLICEEELKVNDKNELSEHFKLNVHTLSQSLSKRQKEEALLCVHQIANSKDSSTVGDETLKLLGKCLVSLSQCSKQGKKLFYRYFIQGIGLDFEDFIQFSDQDFLKEENTIHFSDEILNKLADLMIIVGMADTLDDEEVDHIISVFMEYWNKSHKEVSEFLGEIYDQLDARVKRGESLIDHFKITTEELAELCNSRQVETIKEILHEFIGTDDRVSAQERILYKIFKDHMS